MEAMQYWPHRSDGDLSSINDAGQKVARLQKAEVRSFSYKIQISLHIFSPFCL